MCFLCWIMPGCFCWQVCCGAVSPVFKSSLEVSKNCCEQVVWVYAWVTSWSSGFVFFLDILLVVRCLLSLMIFSWLVRINLGCPCLMLRAWFMSNDLMLRLIEHQLIYWRRAVLNHTEYTKYNRICCPRVIGPGREVFSVHITRKQSSRNTAVSNVYKPSSRNKYKVA